MPQVARQSIDEQARLAALPRGEQHWKWKGGGYSYAHKQVVRARGKASEHSCVDCGSSSRMQWSYVGGDPEEKTDAENGAFSLDPAFYTPRCEPCHFAHDYGAGGRPGMRRRGA